MVWSGLPADQTTSALQTKPPQHKNQRGVRQNCHFGSFNERKKMSGTPLCREFRSLSRGSSEIIQIQAKMKVGWKSLNSQKQANSFRKHQKLDPWKNSCRFSHMFLPLEGGPQARNPFKIRKIGPLEKQASFFRIFLPPEGGTPARNPFKIRGPKGSQVVPSGPKGSQVVPRGPKWSQGVPSGPKGSQVVPRGPKGSQGVPRGPCAFHLG